MQVYVPKDIKKERKGNQALIIYKFVPMDDIHHPFITPQEDFGDAVIKLDKSPDSYLERGYIGIDLRFAKEISSDIENLAEDKADSCPHLHNKKTLLEDLDALLVKENMIFG